MPVVPVWYMFVLVIAVVEPSDDCASESDTSFYLSINTLLHQVMSHRSLEALHLETAQNSASQEHVFLLLRSDDGDVGNSHLVILPPYLNDRPLSGIFQMPGINSLHLILFHGLRLFLGILLVVLALVDSQYQRKFFLELYD